MLGVRFTLLFPETVEKLVLENPLTALPSSLSLIFAGTGNLLIYLHELGALVFIVCKHVESHGLAQFELMGIPWLARTKQPLPFRRTGNVLDIRTIAIGQCALFYEVMSLAVWTLSI